MGAVLQDAASRAANSQVPSLLSHLRGYCTKLAAGGDWDGVHVLIGAIMALAKSEGKGNGASKGDSTEKGSSSKSTGKGGDGTPTPSDALFGSRSQKAHRHTFKEAAHRYLMALTEQTLIAAINQAVASAVQAAILGQAPRM